MKPKKFSVDELLEDASLSQMNAEINSEEYKKWEVILAFLLDYYHSEKHSEFFWANQTEPVSQEDSIEWDTNMKTYDAN